MEKRPKIRVSGPGWGECGELLDIEAARVLPFSPDILVSVEGQVVSSFAELKRLARRKPYKDLDHLEVTLLPIMVGG